MRSRDHARELRAVRTGLAVTILLCAGELVGGWLTGSLALIADAAHMVTDAAALGLTWFAMWIARRQATASKSFGYHRAEIIAALLNGVALWLIVVFILGEAWQRLWQPRAVWGGGMLAFAVAGLLANVFVARVLHRDSRHSLNLRGAYLHVLSDLLGSIGAVAAGIAIVWTGWDGVDPLVSVAIAVLILVGSFTLVREAVDVLMEAVPGHIDVDELRRALEDVPGTAEVHDLHVWSLTTGRHALSAHAVTDGTRHPDAILDGMASLCARRFHIDHVTIQIEHENRRAAEPAH
jgi:cobalt-zinc-cadmium efflux system protein